MRPVVGIDCQKILSPSGGGAGVEHYIHHLVLNLAQAAERSCDLKLYFHPHLQKSSAVTVLSNHPGVQTLFWPESALTRSSLWPYGKYRRQSQFLRAEKLDVFHGPANVTPLFYRQPTVVTVHDLIIYRHPEWFPGGIADYFWRHSLVPKSIKNASRVIAVSQATKRQIIRQFNISPDKISVVYEGGTTKQSGNNLSAQETEALKKKIGSNKFLLYVGTIEPRKNLARLIEAFKSIASKFPGMKLVLAGKFGWKYESILASAKGLEARVIFTDYVSPTQKSWLYQQALGFVYPSLAEGFGLPVLDAMVNKVPVLTSQTSSLPEVTGSAAVYVDPLSVQSIATGLEKLASYENLRRQLIDQGLAQAEKFSWANAAQQTLQVYREVITSRND